MRWVLALLVAACYAPQPQPGAPCANGVCPTGLVCSPATSTCELHAIDAAAGTDTSPPLDGSPDGAPDAPPEAATTPLLVQQATNYADNVSTLSVTLPATPVAGRMLILVGANVSGSLTTVTGGGAIWTLATRSLENSNIEIWYGETSGTNGTVTITRAGGSASTWLSVSEWSGLATTDTLDAARSDFGTANLVTAGSITTTARDLLVFGATGVSPNTHGTVTPGTWTALDAIAGAAHNQSVWYRVEAAAGTFAPQVTQTSNRGWEAAIAALRIAP